MYRLTTDTPQLTTDNRPAIFLFLALFFLTAGCDWMPGKPTIEKHMWKSPESNLDFASLYASNCMACHSGPSGMSSSFSLANSIYLSVIPPEKMREVIAHGVPGTAMPAFSEKKGGRLTEAQIDVLVKGIYAWKDSQKMPAGVSSGSLPSYSAPPGNATRGSQVFATHCAGCHGADGTGGKTAGSVVDSAYLNLVTDQYLRTIIIAGRPELGHPNSQNAVEGKPMSNQDIADVVAWLISHREARKGALPAEMRR